MSDATSNVPAAPAPTDADLADADARRADRGTDGPTPLSPLHDVHVAAGASFTDFAGWQMPVRYTQRPRRAPRRAHRRRHLRPLAHGRDRRLGPGGRRVPRLRARRQAVGASPSARRSTGCCSSADGRHRRRPRRLPHRRGPLPGRRQRVATATPRVAALAEPRAAAFDVEPSTTRATTSRSSPCRARVRARSSTRSWPPTGSTPDDRRVEPAVLPRRCRHASTAARARRPHRLHRRGRLRALRRPRCRRRPLGRARSRPAGRSASSRPASPAATRSASRRACRSTATSSASTPSRCRPASAASSTLAKEGDFVGRAAVEAGPGCRRPRARRPRRRGQARRPRRLRGRSRDRAMAPTRRPVGVVTSGALSPDARPPDRHGLRRPALARRPAPQLAIDVRGTRVPATVADPLPSTARRRD